MNDTLKEFIDYFKNEDWQAQDEILYKLFEVSVNWRCYAEERKEAEKSESAEILANKEPKERYV